jgi:hypothetical protein
LGDFFGLDYRLTQGNDPDWIQITGDGAGELMIRDHFFTGASRQWLTPLSMPKQPLKNWDLAITPIRIKISDHQIPVIYGDDPSNPDFLKMTGHQLSLGLDIFGSAFFMLTRYEEVVKKDRDRHNRFPATASLAYQEGFLNRPIINEYLEILWWCLKRLWPGLERKPRKFQMTVSHDVDHPFRYACKSFLDLLLMQTADALKRRDVKLAISRFQNWRLVQQGFLDRDPCYTFETIMDLSEANGLVSAFYFLTDDPDYRIDHPRIQGLIKLIHGRGHEIGYHGGYESYNNEEQCRREVTKLKAILQKLEIPHGAFGGRQHYLRFDPYRTWGNLEQAGLSYDTTLGYADHSGFRCGICYDYPVYDLRQHRMLKLRERPLIVMEGTLFDYMGLSDGAAGQELQRLMEQCRLYQGRFTLLWHNHSLAEQRKRALYERTLRGAN